MEVAFQFKDAVDVTFFAPLAGEGPDGFPGWTGLVTVIEAGLQTVVDEASVIHTLKEYLSGEEEVWPLISPSSEMSIPAGGLPVRE